MKILIVGLGLIGGSLAKALRKYTPHEIYGMDINTEVIEQAVSENIIKYSDDILTRADLIILCLYPAETLNFLEAHAGKLRQGTVVLDTCGVKGAVCERAAEIALQKGFTFIGGHPMAGRESSGYSASDPELFQDANFIITNEKQCPDWLPPLLRELKFAEIVFTNPSRHDEMIAYTSQLPHILACAYILDERAPDHSGFSAGSFRDVTRVAKINEAMWTELFIDNKEYLSGSIDELINNLTRIKTELDQNNPDGLREILRKSRIIKESLKGCAVE